MNYSRMYYQTRAPVMIMDFVFMEIGGEHGWRIYIINKIDYQGRETDGHSTHRNHFEGDTYPCICWRGRIGSLDEAKAIASLWADTTTVYISLGRRGKGFDEIAAELMKK
jgi:hypothetical protein